MYLFTIFQCSFQLDLLTKTSVHFLLFQIRKDVIKCCMLNCFQLFLTDYLRCMSYRESLQIFFASMFWLPIFNESTALLYSLLGLFLTCQKKSYLLFHLKLYWFYFIIFSLDLDYSNIIKSCFSINLHRWFVETEPPVDCSGNNTTCNILYQIVCLILVHTSFVLTILPIIIQSCFKGSLKRPKIHWS